MSIDRHAQMLNKAIKNLKTKKPTTPPPSKKNTELSAAELQHYVDIVAKAAEGFTPPKAEHTPNKSLLDSIILERLEARGLAPATN